VLEDLNVSGMVKNSPGKAIADVGFYEFRRQMVYKVSGMGCQVILADPFLSSSKRLFAVAGTQGRDGLE